MSGRRRRCVFFLKRKCDGSVLYPCGNYAKRGMTKCGGCLRRAFDFESQHWQGDWSW